MLLTVAFRLHMCLWGLTEVHRAQPGSALTPNTLNNARLYFFCGGSSSRLCTWTRLQTLWAGGGGWSASQCQRGKQKKRCSGFSHVFTKLALWKEVVFFFRFFFLATPEVERHFPKTWLNVVDAGLSSESRGCSCRASVAQAWLGVPDSTETHPALITS